MHSSQINNKSSLSSFTRDLETFENAYYVLLDKSKEILIEYKNEGRNPRYHYKAQDGFLSRERELSRHLIQIFRCFTNLNITYMLFDRNSKGEDETITMFFGKIKDIQAKMSEVMKENLRIKSNYNQFVDYFMEDSHYVSRFLIYSHDVDRFLIHLLELFRSLNMEKEIIDVIQCLLRFSKGLLPFKYVESELKMYGSTLNVTR